MQGQQLVQVLAAGRPARWPLAACSLLEASKVEA
jgi:hypothetical protein